MNIIRKHPVNELGYNFIEAKYLPKGQNEYYLRFQQNPNHKKYRSLTVAEITALEKNNNTSGDWGKVLVSKNFIPQLVKHCEFHGLVRIGNMEPYYLEFHNLRMPVGFYNCKIISCDFGDNVSIDNVNYLSNYIIGNEVMISNVDELASTDKGKFGNGILSDGETEKQRVVMELCNENGGRRVMPFDGMLPGDAHLWSKYIADEELISKFKEFTDKKFDSRRGR